MISGEGGGSHQVNVGAGSIQKRKVLFVHGDGAFVIYGEFVCIGVFVDHAGAGGVEGLDGAYPVVGYIAVQVIFTHCAVAVQVIGIGFGDVYEHIHGPAAFLDGFIRIVQIELVEQILVEQHGEGSAHGTVAVIPDHAVQTAVGHGEALCRVLIPVGLSQIHIFEIMPVQCQPFVAVAVYLSRVVGDQIVCIVPCDNIRFGIGVGVCMGGAAVGNLDIIPFHDFGVPIVHGVVHHFPGHFFRDLVIHPLVVVTDIQPEIVSFIIRFRKSCQRICRFGFYSFGVDGSGVGFGFRRGVSSAGSKRQHHQQGGKNTGNTYRRFHMRFLSNVDFVYISAYQYTIQIFYCQEGGWGKSYDRLQKKRICSVFK